MADSNPTPAPSENASAAAPIPSGQDASAAPEVPAAADKQHGENNEGGSREDRASRASRYKRHRGGKKGGRVGRREWENGDESREQQAAAADVVSGDDNGHVGGKRKAEDVETTGGKKVHDGPMKKGRYDGRAVKGFRTPREIPEGEEKEERRPKKKVAVYIGYCGKGYYGLQLNPPLKTIEGDLFDAFVKAGAISKANSDDPKKSSLVRCARTDKGVHAAGNLLSLKLIIEDKDIVEKINSHLPPAIRVWGIQRTTGGFSCYALCDSRKYEYLMPTHAFLPPRPGTFLAGEIEKWCEREGKWDEYRAAQGEGLKFWEEVDKKALEMFGGSQETLDAVKAKMIASERDGDKETAVETVDEDTKEDAADPNAMEVDGTPARPLDQVKQLKKLILKMKREYRITPDRLERIRAGMAMYLGTRNFWNYTVNKNFKDASAQRFIMKFEALDPILVEGTEWLRIQVHGQSFMMHQIRKMVGLVLMITRLGAPLELITKSYTGQAMPIPKAPGIGLFLDRPLFETYNKRAPQHGHQAIDFDKFEDKIEAFKREMIYKTMYDEEAQMAVFNNFVNFIDNFRDSAFLYMTPGGQKAVEEGQKMIGNSSSKAKKELMEEDEGQVDDGGEQ